MILSALIVTFFVIAVLQYLYYTVVAPLLREFAKEKIFALKHRLLYGHANSRFSDYQAVEVLEKSISSAIENLPYFNLYAIYRAKRLVETERQLATLIEERNLVFDKTADPEMREIVILLDEYLFRILMINSGGLLFWAWPLIVISYIHRQFVKRWARQLRSMMRSWVFVPESVVVR